MLLTRLLAASVLSSALASTFRSLTGREYTFLAAADSAGYGPQPFELQTLSGEIVVDPFLLSMINNGSNGYSGWFQLVPNVSLGEQAEFLFNSCLISERMARVQVQGRIVLTSPLNLLKCAISRSIDSFFVDIAALGAIGVVSVMPEFGTRYTCSTKYSDGRAGVPPGNIPYFCIDIGDVRSGVQVAAGSGSRVEEAALFGFFLNAFRIAALGKPLYTEPIVAGYISLEHDWVPLDHLRSPGAYAYFLLLAAWASGVSLFSGACLVSLLAWARSSPQVVVAVCSRSTADSQSAHVAVCSQSTADYQSAHVAVCSRSTAYYQSAHVAVCSRVRPRGRSPPCCESGHADC